MDVHRGRQWAMASRDERAVAADEWLVCVVFGSFSLSVGGVVAEEIRGHQRFRVAAVRGRCAGVYCRACRPNNLAAQLAAVERRQTGCHAMPRTSGQCVLAVQQSSAGPRAARPTESHRDIDLAASCNAFTNASLAAPYSLLVAAGQAELMTMINRSSLNVVMDWPKIPSAS